VRNHASPKGSIVEICTQFHSYGWDLSMSDQVIVTIGLCVRNAERLIGRAIHSVLIQDLPHRLMEIVVVEGQSEDRTHAVVEFKLREADIEYKIFFENSGLGKARQIVVDNAAGKYIVWVDEDMVIPETYIRRQVEFMEENSSVGIASGKYGVTSSRSVVADLENVVYVVDSVFGDKSASALGPLPGTEGSIYRVDAIRELGGFDTRMEGAAEDTEIAYRLVAEGWKTAVTQEVFIESTRLSWKDLWDQYFWYGRGSHFIFHKDSRMMTLWKMTPLSGFAAGVLRLLGAYRLTHRKMVLLLPIHYTFKRSAWLAGFLKAHWDGYGHFK